MLYEVEVHPPDGAFGGCLDESSRRDSGRLCTGQKTVDVSLGEAGGLRQLAGRNSSGGELGAEIRHASESNTRTLLVQGVTDYLGSDRLHDMTRWPKQAAFRKALSEYGKAHGLTQADIADQLGTTVGTLRQWLYNKTRVPDFANIQKIAGFLRVPVSDLVDDPGASVLGQDLSGLTDQGRFLASMVVKDLVSEDLTDEDRAYLAEDYLRAAARLRSMRSQAAARAGADRTGKK